MCWFRNTVKSFASLPEIVEHLLSLISTDVDEIFTLRSDVLGSALIGIDRKAFSVHKTLEVSYTLYVDSEITLSLLCFRSLF